MASEITDFCHRNLGTANPAVVWDAFKAHTRGQNQFIIGKVGRESSQTLEEAENRARELEAQYVSTRSVDICRDLKVLYKEIAVPRTTASLKILLSQTQRIFEQGERTGRLLACLAKESSHTTHIAHISSVNGTRHSTPDQINAQFKSFYEHLYSSRISYDTDSLIGFLDTIDFLELSL